jgi:hypothetical protein
VRGYDNKGWCTIEVRYNGMTVLPTSPTVYCAVLLLPGYPEVSPRLCIYLSLSSLLVATLQSVQVSHSSKPTITHHRTALQRTKASQNTPHKTRRIPPCYITMLFFIAALFLVTAYASPLNTTTIDTASEDTWRASLWLNTATYSLLCYDVVVVVVFGWCWVCGLLWWMKRDPGVGEGWHDVDWSGMGEGRGSGGRRTMMEGEMRRVGMF